MLGRFGLAAAVTMTSLASPVASAQSPAPPDDYTLTRLVQDRLKTAPALQRSSIRVQVQNGHARLTGSAANLWAVWEAERIAGQVYGLESVEVELAVDSRASDAAISSDLANRFRGISRWNELGFEVTSGTVTLTGHLRDARSRLDARKTAATVRGVQEMRDSISVPNLADDKILSYLERRYAGRSGKRPEGTIQAAVSGGTVTLSGEVPRPSASIEAERLAWGVNGVHEVRNKLTVVPEIPEKVKVSRP
jgi:osmotically-inducible protein OsmY